MNGAHPLASRWRHSSHGRIEAVEVPVLVAEVARNDLALLGERRRRAALVAEDRSSDLVLESVAVAVFLSDGSSTKQGASEEFGGAEGDADERDLRGRSVLLRVDEIACGTSGDWRRSQLLSQITRGLEEN